MPTGPANFETIYWQLISIIWNLRLSLWPRRMFWYILDIMHCQYYADSLQTSTQILSSCCHGKMGQGWDYYTNNLQTSKHHCDLSKIFPKFMIDVTGKTNQATYSRLQKYIETFWSCAQTCVGIPHNVMLLQYFTLHIMLPKLSLVQ